MLVSGVASMALGFLWYGPLFGKMWMKLSGMTKEKMEEAKKKGMTTGYILSFVGALVMAYVPSHSLVFASSYTKVMGVSAGIMAGFWSWLGFVAPVTLSSILWDGKSWNLWILNNGYHLLQLLIMGTILSAWK
ncbi:DUF1761 domain-containing protein [Candidatus Uhrbacteria bacterium]|nr:DUF1761 domain-containing protein [Candidatus Uhrbacteria bacterium]